MARAKHVDNELIDLLYQAAGQTGLWEDFLAALAARVVAPGVAFMFHCPKEDQYQVDMQFGLPPESLPPYAEYYGKVDPWWQLVQMNSAGSVELGSSACAPSDFLQTEFYNDFLRKHRPFLYQAAVLLENNHEGYGVLTCLREPRQIDFSRETTGFLGDLFPHLRWAMQVHRKMIDYRKMAEAGRAVLDKLDLGLIGILSNGMLSFANEQAEMLLKSGEFLSIKNGKITCTESRQDVALRKIWHSVNTRCVANLPGGTLTLRRGARCLHVIVLPWGNDDNRFSPRPGALLFLIDPATKPQSRQALLQKLFGLTAVQANIGMLLLHGLQSKQIAGRIGCTPEDVRYHLTQIYRKTNVEGQTQLARLISLLPGNAHDVPTLDQCQY